MLKLKPSSPFQALRQAGRVYRQAGFTMIELLVVTTIIIVLTTIAIVSFQPAGQNARNAKRKADLETVRQALVLYRTAGTEYPVGDDFTDMLNEITDYLNNTNVSDPKGSGNYVYSYSSDGSTFSLCANFEPDEAGYCLTNP